MNIYVKASIAIMFGITILCKLQTLSLSSGLPEGIGIEAPIGFKVDEPDGSGEAPGADGLNETQRLAIMQGASLPDVKSAWLQFEDGTFRYFDADSLMVRNRLTPEGIYIDDEGIPHNPDDNNINYILVRYASLGRRALAIDKSAHVLELWEDGKYIKRYMVTFGGARGDKVIQGDYKTPCGYFYICVKRNVSDLLKGELGLNYPDMGDARRGLRDGIIDASTAEMIISANRNLQKPSWNTALGGAIEVHGNGHYRDQTAGCIGINNNQIYEVYNVMQLGDRVIICE